ncbi:CheR family methyltransferase [Chitinivibrio alkaliphilus]|uniref:protein-glutamate O-methyltransferase n=1 Tax=Chitinivibrio alkaliphilus ACht1 TaxID=1313304 RepID=U7D6J5_9BACT|nr:CheR family methyltransferase [Chitinivibrio alkaliphilus]ERP32139.1 MCP methyltransferase/methylesterase CheR/CheB [Chitinivibrio alkaliphilus ACht1]
MSSKHIDTTVSDFLLVGIGASAGGLQSLQSFFDHLDPEIQASYIIVQHLSPDFKSLMDELLARHTDLPIQYAQDNLEVRSQHVYLIPPGHNLEIYQKRLYLSTPSADKKLTLPIDIFFRSLAAERTEKTVAIILSGTGSDGTLGCRAIKEAGGMIMCQDNQSARFAGMPESLISTGIVDYILSPGEIAQTLKRYSKHPFVQQNISISDTVEKNKNHLGKIFSLLRNRTGADFSQYKESTIYRQLEKRITINQLTRIEDYTAYLEKTPKEAHLLYKDFLIGVTRFFRDPEAFEKIRTDVIPHLFAAQKATDTLRVWSISCSTGEEAYTLAMLFHEYMEKHECLRHIKIFATDIDSDSIDYASAGHYPENIVSDIPATYLSRYFTKTDTGFRVKKILRNMIIFARQDVLHDPPFSRIDLIVCRNMMIYLKKETQQRLLNLIYFSLMPHGVLFLGSSEAIGNMVEGFETMDTKWKIYKYKKGLPLQERLRLPFIQNTFTPMKDKKTKLYRPHENKGHDNSTIRSETLTALIAPLLPPTVITDAHQRLVYTLSDSSDYISIPTGEMNLRITAMIRYDSLAIALSSLLKKAETTQKELRYTNIALTNNTRVTLSVQRVTNTQGNTYYRISFLAETPSLNAPTSDTDTLHEDYSLVHNYRQRISSLEEELKQKDESLQATIEELESANEELQTSNEELIASNEELQSSNEELESVNEELYTVNTEHQEKIQELHELNSDIKNVLKTTHVGSLFLDNSLRIRKYTDVIEQITHVQKSDIGRSIEELATEKIYPQFLEDIHTVSRSLTEVYREIKMDASRWYTIKILPYRDSENAVNGIIVSFMDTTESYIQRRHQEETRDRLNRAMEMGNLAWWEWDVQENRVITSPGKATMLGYDCNDIGSGYEGWVSLLHPDDVDMVMNTMREHMEGKRAEYNVRYRIRQKDGSYAQYHDIGGIVKQSKDGEIETIAGIVILEETSEGDMK